MSNDENENKKIYMKKIIEDKLFEQLTSALNEPQKTYIETKFLDKPYKEFKISELYLKQQADKVLRKIKKLYETEKKRLKEEAARKEEEARLAEEQAKQAAERQRKAEEQAKQAAERLAARKKAEEEEHQRLEELLNKEELPIIDAMNYFDNAVTQENIADDFISIEVNQAGEVEGGKKQAKKPKRKANKTKRVKKSNKKKRKPKRKTMRKIKKIIFR